MNSGGWKILQGEIIGRESEQAGKLEAWAYCAATSTNAKCSNQEIPDNLYMEVFPERDTKFSCSLLTFAIFFR